MTPATAPPYYRPTFDVVALARNIAEYTDRVATLPVVALLLAVAILGRARPLLDPATRAIVSAGLAWIVGAFALTVFVPVRSDVYVCLPAVGACLIAAALTARLWAPASAARQRRALVAAVIILVALSPVYFVRTGRWVKPAEFGASAIQELIAATASLPENARVVITDDRSQRVNLGTAFGSLMDDAYALMAGRRVALWIEPPPADAGPDGPPTCVSCVSLRLRVVDGHLRQVSGPARVP